MYVGIDVGGTKTLIAVLDDNGVIIEEVKFSTPVKYEDFLKDLRTNLDSLKNHEFKAGGLAIPASSIDRDHGVGVSYGNLPWHNTPIQHDIEAICGCPIAIENDAKLAALSEAMALKDRFSKVLYVTVSTGIGFGLVDKGIIDKDIGDSGGRSLLIEHDGKMVPWESFASGHAIVERYGKMAKDIDDAETWQNISHDLAKGFIELIAITQPEVIVIGGSVGNYFDKFGGYLIKAIEAYKIPIIDLPVIVKAARPDEAVVYGCYDLAKQVYSNA